MNKILDFIYLPSTHMQDSPWWREVFRHVLLPSLALQEMSPIDIVPMAPQSHEETFHDNTQSDIGYMNHGYGSMDRSGTVPRRPTNGHVKHVSHQHAITIDVVRTYVYLYICMYVQYRHVYACHCGGVGASFPLLLQISVYTQYRLPTDLSVCEG